MKFFPRTNALFDTVLDDMFTSPIFSTRNDMAMKTDITEKDGKYLLDMELPGCKKEDIHLRAGLLGEDIMDKDERLFQAMWRAYFQSTAIRERLNPRLQRQHMPARFWRFLPEKR